MSTKFWRRLAGCIATSVLFGASPEYRAGAGESDHVRAVVVEDRRGHRAVFADADFPITRAISDFVAVQLVKSYDFGRADIVISGTGPHLPDASAIVAAIEQSVAGLAPVSISGGAAISIRTVEGACLATIPLRATCTGGASSHGPIRTAFQMVDLPHPLQTREAAPQAYPVQAIAIGQTTILALGGDIPAGRAGGVVIGHANDVTTFPHDARVDAAIANVLKRVR